MPGGGVREGTLAPWVRSRFDRAIELHEGAPIICLSGGTLHRPMPLDANGHPIFEAVAGARYLLSRGIAPDRIFTETASWDTVGNAFFARLIHTDPRGWRRLMVVTSDFHLQRVTAIFRWVFSLGPDLGYELSFEGTPDSGIAAGDLEARRRHEQAGIDAAGRIEVQTLAELHQWMYERHGAYRADATGKPRSTSTELQRTY